MPKRNRLNKKEDVEAEPVLNQGIYSLSLFHCDCFNPFECTSNLLAVDCVLNINIYIQSLI